MVVRAKSLLAWLGGGGAPPGRPAHPARTPRHRAISVRRRSADRHSIAVLSAKLLSPRQRCQSTPHCAPDLRVPRYSLTLLASVTNSEGIIKTVVLLFSAPTSEII